MLTTNLLHFCDNRPNSLWENALSEREGRITSHQNHDFDANIKLIQRLLEGDVSIAPDLYEHYKYIAEQTSRHTHTKTETSIPYEDIQQQAHYELYNALVNRVPHSGKDWLAVVNENKSYEPCLGMRAYLISTVRQMLKLFILERTSIIRPHKVIFEKDYITKNGEPNPPKCVSMVATSRNDEEFILPGAIPVDLVQPIDNAIASELKAALGLTAFETKILDMRVEGKTLGDIANATGKSAARVYRMIQSIQARHTMWKRSNG